MTKNNISFRYNEKELIYWIKERNVRFNNLNGYKKFKLNLMGKKLNLI